jgi:hypothetical protein
VDEAWHAPEEVMGRAEGAENALPAQFIAGQSRFGLCPDTVLSVDRTNVLNVATLGIHHSASTSANRFDRLESGHRTLLTAPPNLWTSGRAIRIPAC